MDVVVIGAGPAGVAAAFRTAELGARTTLVARDHFGDMAANDGPVPVRTLAQIAAAAMAAGAAVDVLAGLPPSSPTHANVLGRAASIAARQLDAPGVWGIAELTLAPERGRGWRHA